MDRYRQIIVIMLQILCVIWGIYAMTKKNRKKMMVHLFITNFISFLVYLVNQNYITSLTSGILLARNFAFIYKDKFKTNKIFWIFLLLQISVSVFTFSNILDIIPIISASLATIFSWFCNTQQMRIGFCLTDSLWFAYNLTEGLYIQSISNFIGMSSKGFLAIKNSNLFLKNKKEHKQQKNPL